MTDSHSTLPLLTRIAEALERLAPPSPPPAALKDHAVWLWNGKTLQLEPVRSFSALPLELLHGIKHIGDILHANSLQFAQGLPANNALLWGARGMGKSSLVKSVFAECSTNHPQLRLIEINRDELHTLPTLLCILQDQSEYPCILFCDDLSFDAHDSSYKSLKAVLDGSVSGRPQHVIFYATSNRRHLMPREMMENERKTALHPGETVEEKLSLSDRFGLWLGFHGCTQDAYLAMVHSYARYFNLAIDKDLDANALEWAATRGNRSGRVAWQFITDLAGKQGKPLNAPSKR